MQRCLNLKITNFFILNIKINYLDLFNAVKDMFVHNFLKSKFEYIIYSYFINKFFIK